MSDKGMKKLAEAIGFVALVAGAVTLEIHGHATGGLWALIMVWAFFL
ncbi:hypothetical protein [Laribacter hongkongensis]|nr:hypothetical protein [Laribacter hongkongensis]MCG9079461.1 hypothetical protein [Laribacter hongkongensis]